LGGQSSVTVSGGESGGSRAVDRGFKSGAQLLKIPPGALSDIYRDMHVPSSIGWRHDSK
jgi:hypothetical protein